MSWKNVTFKDNQYLINTEYKLKMIKMVSGPRLVAVTFDIHYKIINASHWDWNTENKEGTEAV